MPRVKFRYYSPHRDDLTATTFIIDGYKVYADRALLSKTTLKVHAIDCHQFTMSCCGLGARSHPMETITVCDEKLTCRRCVLLVISAAMRNGVIDA